MDKIEWEVVRLYELSLILKVPTAYFFEYHEFLSKDIGNKKQLLKDIHGVINLFESVKSESIRKNMIQAVKSVFKTAMEFEDE